jgi:hypothetical protein
MGGFGIDPREIGCGEWKWMEISNATCGISVGHLYDSARINIHKYRRPVIYVNISESWEPG